ncbi:MAG: ABC transporter permease [Roseovarius indicus]
MKKLHLFGEPVTPQAFIGLTIIGIYAILAFFAPIISPYDATETLGPVWGPPEWGHWLGFDNLGRDMLSRIIYGTPVTIGTALAASILSYLIGCTLGFIAAMSSSFVDGIISRVMDVFLAIPTLVFALALLTVFNGIFALIAAIGILSAPRVFRIARAVAMDITALEYVEVARLRGEPRRWSIFQEVAPNALPALVAEFGLRVSYSLLFISSLSFLGFGVQPPLADWGSLVRENVLVIGFGGFAALYPAGALALLAVGVSLVVDWVLSFGQRKGEEW